MIEFAMCVVLFSLAGAIMTGTYIVYKETLGSKK